MSVVANKFIALSILAVSCVVLDGGAIAQTATPVQPAAAQGQPVVPMSPREQQAREAMAGQELLLTLSSRVSESNRRLQATEERLSAQLSKTTWLILGGLVVMLLFALMTGAGGYQLAKYRAARKEREMIEAGKEPLSVLIHTTRDHVTRLAQRLKMAGATDSRLFEGLVAALPALQVEAGKATINLSRQIPKSDQPYLEGPVMPLDRARRPERATPAPVPLDSRRAAPTAADVGVAAIGRVRTGTGS